MKRFACKVLEGEWKGGNGREGDRVGQVRDSQASRRSWPATAWWWYRQAANNGHDDEDEHLASRGSTAADLSHNMWEPMHPIVVKIP